MSKGGQAVSGHGGLGCRLCWGVNWGGPPQRETGKGADADEVWGAGE